MKPQKTPRAETYLEVQERAPKAYKDLDFINRRSARTMRILAEYLQPQEILQKHKIHHTAIFFGSARILSPERLERRKTDYEQRRAAARTAAEKAALKTVKKEIDVAERYSKYYQAASEAAALITEWSLAFKPGKRIYVCSGGGPGIMEAANRGAHEAGGRSVGLNISLPFEQAPNGYISPELNFEFHYFFMRKYWFLYLAKAMLVFPGGFGTMDELFELLTLVQTGKIVKKIPIILYGSEFWNKVFNFKALADFGMISRSDLDLFRIVDDPREAFDIIVESLPDEYHSHKPSRY